MIIAGIGCRSLCPAEDIIAVLRDAESRGGLVVGKIAVPSFKSAEPGIAQAAITLGLELILVEDHAIAEAQQLCVTQSPTVHHHTGHAAIAEAACLAAAGPGAILRVARIAHARATCALAETA